MEKFKSKHLTHDQVFKITQAVVQAEMKTDGEIVPMIVARSSSVGHVFFHTSLLLLSFILLLALVFEPWWFFTFKWQALAVTGIFSSLGGFLLSKLNFVQRWLIPPEDQEAQVWQRAQAEWASNKLQKTKARTGILIFVSIMERKAVVLADEGIAKHYSPETWKEVVDILSLHLKRNEWVLGFQKAVEKCGQILQKHLPASHSANEISDHLIIKN